MKADEIAPAAVVQAKRPIADRYKRHLNRAVEGPVEVSKAHPLVKIDFANFGWNENVRDRNWWWCVQQLPSLAWASGDLHSLGPSLSQHVVQLNCSVIESWSKCCRRASPSPPLSWHDHASALRALNLLRWANTLVAAGYSGEEVLICKELVIEHAYWLADEDNYSWGNNHGFEQSWILLEIASDWPKCANFQNLADLARNRLCWEIKNAFTDEGVHKENSPDYQCFMVKRLRALERFLRNRHLSLPDVDLPALIGRAQEFLLAISSRAGCLPLIGDTQEKVRQQDFITSIQGKGDDCLKSGMFDFSNSGYFVWKTLVEGSKSEAHLVVKSAHESAYHRHDDDLMMNLSIDDITVFADAGLFSHDGQSPIRKFVRSRYAHTTLYPVHRADPPRDPRKLRKKPVLHFNPFKNSVSGKSFAFESLILRRRWKLLNNRAQFLRIIDTVTNNSEHTVEMWSSFLLGEHVEYEVETEGDDSIVKLHVGESTFTLRLFDVGCGAVRIYRGWAKDIKQAAVISRRMGHLCESARVTASWKALPMRDTQVEFSLAMDPK